MKRQNPLPVSSPLISYCRMNAAYISTATLADVCSNQFTSRMSCLPRLSKPRFAYCPQIICSPVFHVTKRLKRIKASMKRSFLPKISLHPHLNNHYCKDFSTMAPSKPLVLFFSPVRHALSAYKELQQVAHTEVVTTQSRDEFFNDVATKYQNFVAIYRTSSSGSVSLILRSIHTGSSEINGCMNRVNMLTTEYNVGSRKV